MSADERKALRGPTSPLAPRPHGADRHSVSGSHGLDHLRGGWSRSAGCEARRLLIPRGLAVAGHPLAAADLTARRPLVVPPTEGSTARGSFGKARQHAPRTADFQHLTRPSDRPRHRSSDSLVRGESAAHALVRWAAFPVDPLTDADPYVTRWPKLDPSAGEHSFPVLGVPVDELHLDAAIVSKVEAGEAPAVEVPTRCRRTPLVLVVRALVAVGGTHCACPGGRRGSGSRDRWPRGRRCQPFPRGRPLRSHGPRRYPRGGHPLMRGASGDERLDA
jgi:hypothetical protein